MLAEADLQRVNQPFWTAFWEYLWNRIPPTGRSTAALAISEERLRSFLTGEIAPRYDQQASAAVPVPGSTNFQPGKPGTVLDIDRAVLLIEDALRSPTSRTVNLTFSRVDPTRPSLQNLQVLLNQVIDLSHFDGIAEMYLLDLQTNQELHFAYQTGKNAPAGYRFHRRQHDQNPDHDLHLSACLRIRCPRISPIT